MNNKERKYGLIVALLLLVLLLGAIALVATQSPLFFGNSGSPSQFVDVPVVETHLVAADGNLHMFGTRVVIEFDNDVADFDRDWLHSVVLAAVSSLNYEDITDYYGMENLRNAVHSRLSGSFNDEQLLGVFFAQFLSDMPLPNLEEERVPGRNPFAEIFIGN